jgi:hypothetical protein
MKRLCRLLSFWVFISFFGCEEHTPITLDLTFHCADAGAFTKTVENVNGRIFYDPTETKYMVLVPNSIDGNDVGFVCSLSPEFQKEGLPVKFSGRYHAYNKTLKRFAGDKFYFLSIETISPR